MGSKILVVDDEKLIVKGIKFSLEQDGFEVTAAYDGEEALNYIKEGNSDIRYSCSRYTGGSLVLFRQNAKRERYGAD